MDVAFLGGEGEAAGGSGSPRRDRKRLFDRRSDAIAYGSPYQKAAALVDLAEDGIGIPEEIFDLPSFGSSLKSYLIFIQFDFLWSLNYFALILLNFLEKPLWCSEECSNRDFYYLGQLPYLTGAESLIYEGVTLLILIVHIPFPITYEGFSIFWKNHINRLKIIFWMAAAVALPVHAIFCSLRHAHCLRWLFDLVGALMLSDLRWICYIELHRRNSALKLLRWYAFGSRSSPWKILVPWKTCDHRISWGKKKENLVVT